MEPLKVTTQLIEDMQKYGAFDINACFNCGNCTAVCPLVEEDIQFPRQIIRLAQLGQKDKILASKELWTCYYCGECTDTCPREAQPGEFMMAARRYAIADYDVTNLGKVLYTNKWLSALFFLVVSIFMGWFATVIDAKAEGQLLLGHYYFEAIHIAGVWMGIGFTLLIALGALKMYRNIVTTEPLRQRKYIMNEVPFGKKLSIATKSLFSVGINEVLVQKRYQRDEPVDPTPINRRIVHLSISLGFLGLLIATGLNFLVQKPAGSNAPEYLAIRLLGIISGLALVYGTSIALWFRITGQSTYYSSSKFTDWLLISLLWVVGITGFFTTILVYMNPAPEWAHWVLVLHVIVAADVLIMMPFSKMAHILYRPIALWMLAIQRDTIAYLEEVEKARKAAERAAKKAAKEAAKAKAAAQK